MIFGINQVGVSPKGYAAFTDYIVTAGTDTEIITTQTYERIVSAAARNLYLFMGFIVFLVICVIVLFLLFSNYITFVPAIVCIVMALAVFILYFGVILSFYREATLITGKEFGAAASQTALYTASSLYRNALYLALLR